MIERLKSNSIAQPISLRGNHYLGNSIPREIIGNGYTYRHDVDQNMVCIIMLALPSPNNLSVQNAAQAYLGLNNILST